MRLLVEVAIIASAVILAGILGGIISLGYYLRDIAMALDTIVRKP